MSTRSGHRWAAPSLEHIPANGHHGNGCWDLPSIFAGVRAHEALIRSAAEQAGHPLAAGDALGAEPRTKSEGDPGEDENEDEDERI